MGIHPPLRAPRLVALARPLPSVDALILGQPIEVAFDLLPRIFNLCRTAQTMALRLALGQEERPGDRAALTQEILRDHLLRLAVVLPRRLGLDPVSFTPKDTHKLRFELFGETKNFPTTPNDFKSFLTSRQGIAPVLSALYAGFGCGEAICPVLPTPNGDVIRLSAAAENSVAMRHTAHPVMREIERQLGRGPMWRVVARALDLQACLDNTLPAPVVMPGSAAVPAARGLYMVTAEANNGILNQFARLTPTDHLLAPGGIMEHCLASLPPEKNGQADLICDILDPCSPVTVQEVRDA